ncbi:glycosyltransferase family A protein [uncultured Prevotella sp.]|uniref:glycosyltransferase family 2 protein n=1 Tax=uncultured Prevotella sp. TaxID=159272 RepID=UPI0027E24668|nr:glycosyltransferase family A protein [uncultured Prevotella sp.]
MKITVIVPTYKPQAYLWECLDSIYKQTFPKTDYELVLVLNGCDEPYNTQINEWLTKHSDLQVQYFQTDEGGVSNARNIALDNARGEYVTFIDDDDIISTACLEELYEKATPDTVSLCYPYAFNDGYLDEQLPYRISDAFKYCVKNKCTKISSKVRKFFSGPCMKLIPFSFIQNRRFDKRFKNGEDSLFMFLISDKIHNVAFTSKNAIYYRRIRVGSASNQKRVFKTILTSQMLITKEYFKIYLTNTPKYNFSFFLTRIMGAIYSVLIKK